MEVQPDSPPRIRLFLNLHKTCERSEYAVILIRILQLLARAFSGIIRLIMNQ
jgi:hypothetical protein